MIQTSTLYGNGPKPGGNEVIAARIKKGLWTPESVREKSGDIMQISNARNPGKSGDILQIYNAANRPPLLFYSISPPNTILLAIFLLVSNVP